MDNNIGKIFLSLTGTPLTSMLKMISILDSMFPVATSKQDYVTT